MGVFDNIICEGAIKKILDALGEFDNIYLENCISIRYEGLTIEKIERVSYRTYLIHYSNDESILLKNLPYSDSNVLYLKLQDYKRNFELL
jgi:hypothetical protein